MSQTIEHPNGFACTCRDGGVAVVKSVQQVPALLRILQGWGRRRRQMQALLDLDDRLLRDIGISREEAVREAAQLYWRTYARRHLK